MGMALFSDLGQLQNHTVAGKNRSHGKVFEFKTFHQKIFPEIAVLHTGAPLLEGLDGFF